MAVDLAWWKGLDKQWQGLLKEKFKFASISPAVLEALAAATHLDLAKTKVRSLAPAQQLSSLEVVNFSGCTELTSFEGLPPSVRVATFYWLTMDDLSWLDALPNLEKAYADDAIQRQVKQRIAKNRKAAIKGGTAKPAAGEATRGETLLYALGPGEKLGRGRDVEYYGSPVGAAPTGGRVTFVRVEKAGKTFLVENGKKGQAWDDLRLIGFTPDGSRVTFIAAAKKKERLVIGGEALTPTEKVVEYTFSKAGAAAWVAKIGKKMQVVEPGGPEHPGVEYVCNLAFDDAGRLHYDANRGGAPDKRVQGHPPTTTGQWSHAAGGKETAIPYERVGTLPACSWSYPGLIWPTVQEEVKGEETLTFDGDAEVLGHALRYLREGKSVGVAVDGARLGGVYDRFYLLCASAPAKWLRFFAARKGSVVMLEQPL